MNRQTIGNIQVRHSRDSLIFEVARKRSLTSILFNAILAGVFAVLLIRSLFGETNFQYFGVLFATGSYALSRKSESYSLRVNRFELISTGSKSAATSGICLADLDSLEYQKDETGPEDASHPQGLYAVMGEGAVCVLPEIDREEAEGVIREMTARFPVIAELMERRKSRGRRAGNITTLNLSDVDDALQS